MRNLLTFNCISCGKEKTQTYNESKNAFLKKKYCSHSCKSKHMPTKYWEGKKISGKRKTGWKHSVEKNQEKSLRQKGRIFSEETRLKISESQKGKTKEIRGKLHWNWKGGITTHNHKIRTSLEYKQWRKSVFERDNYSCKECGARCSAGSKVILNADHIKPFATFPELRLSVDNGRTLCAPCHRKTETWGVNKKYLEITKS